MHGSDKNMILNFWMQFKTKENKISKKRSNNLLLTLMMEFTKI